MQFIQQQFGNLSPLKQLLQYIWHRLMGKFINKNNDIKYSLFGGDINLKNLELNCQKINEDILQSAPFYISYGRIGKLSVKMPWNVLKDQIFVTIDDVEIEFNLKKDIKFEKNYQPQESNEKQNVDRDVNVWTKLVKKIIQNIQVMFFNINIKLHLENSASVVLQLDSFKLQKKKLDSVNINKSIEILREDKDEFYLYGQGLFVFVSTKQAIRPYFWDKRDPSCILAIDPSKNIIVEYEIQKNEEIQSKFLSINLPPIEFIIEPNQIKTLFYFIQSIQNWQIKINTFMKKQQRRNQNQDKQKIIIQDQKDQIYQSEDEIDQSEDEIDQIPQHNYDLFKSIINNNQSDKFNLKNVSIFESSLMNSIKHIKDDIQNFDLQNPDKSEEDLIFNELKQMNEVELDIKLFLKLSIQQINCTILKMNSFQINRVWIFEQTQSQQLYNEIFLSCFSLSCQKIEFNTIDQNSSLSIDSLLVIEINKLKEIDEFQSFYDQQNSKKSSMYYSLNNSQFQNFQNESLFLIFAVITNNNSYQNLSLMNSMHLNEFCKQQQLYENNALQAQLSKDSFWELQVSPVFIHLSSKILEEIIQIFYPYFHMQKIVGFQEYLTKNIIIDQLIQDDDDAMTKSIYRSIDQKHLNSNFQKISDKEYEPLNISEFNVKVNLQTLKLILTDWNFDLAIIGQQSIINLFQSKTEKQFQFQLKSLQLQEIKITDSLLENTLINLDQIELQINQHHENSNNFAQDKLHEILKQSTNLLSFQIQLLDIIINQNVIQFINKIQNSHFVKELPINLKIAKDSYEDIEKFIQYKVNPLKIKKLATQSMAFNVDINESNLNLQLSENDNINLNIINFKLFGIEISEQNRIQLKVSDMHLTDSTIECAKIGSLASLVKDNDPNESEQKTIFYQQKIYFENKKYQIFPNQDYEISSNDILSILIDQSNQSADFDLRITGLIFRYQHQDLTKRIDQIKKFFNLYHREDQSQFQYSEQNLNPNNQNYQISQTCLKKNKSQQKSKRINFTIKILDFAIDIFPQYDIQDVKINSSLFHMKDINISQKKNSKYFHQTRSILSIDEFNCLIYQKDENLDNFNIQANNLCLQLLKSNDYEIKTNPILLVDHKYSISDNHGIVNSLGFVKIIEISQIIISKDQNLFLDIDFVQISFCHDSLKSFINHLQIIEFFFQKNQLQIDENQHNYQDNNDDNNEIHYQDEEYEYISYESFKLMEERKRKINEFEKIVINENHTTKVKLLHRFQDCQFKLNMQQLSLNLYGGNDFKFKLCENIVKYEEKIENNSKNQKNDGKIVIIQDYFLQANKNNHILKIREKLDARNNSDYLNVQLKNFCYTHARHSNMQRNVISIREFFVKDKCQNSQNQLLLCQENQKQSFLEAVHEFKYPDYPNEQIQEQQKIKKKVQFEKQNQDQLEDDEFFQIDDYEQKKKSNIDEQFAQVPINNEETWIFLKIAPIQIFANVQNIQFLKKFFKLLETQHEAQNFGDHKNHFSLDKSDGSEKIDGKNIKKSPYIQLIFLQETKILVDYDNQFDQLGQVLTDHKNLINIGNLNDFCIQIARVEHNSVNINTALNTIFKYLQRDILNQKIVEQFPYVRNALNILEGITDIFYMPYQNIRQGESFTTGVKNGVQSFLVRTTKEGLGLGLVITNLFDQYLNHYGCQRRKRSIVTDLFDYGLNKIDDKQREKNKIKYKQDNKNVFEI